MNAKPVIFTAALMTTLLAGGIGAFAWHESECSAPGMGEIRSLFSSASVNNRVVMPSSSFGFSISPSGRRTTSSSKKYPGIRTTLQIDRSVEDLAAELEVKLRAKGWNVSRPSVPSFARGVFSYVPYLTAVSPRKLACSGATDQYYISLFAARLEETTGVSSRVFFGLSEPKGDPSTVVNVQTLTRPLRPWENWLSFLIPKPTTKSKSYMQVPAPVRKSGEV